jgi:hypothetical protein
MTLLIELAHLALAGAPTNFNMGIVLPPPRAPDIMDQGNLVFGTQLHIIE